MTDVDASAIIVIVPGASRTSAERRAGHCPVRAERREIPNKCPSHRGINSCIPSHLHRYEAAFIVQGVRCIFISHETSVEHGVHLLHTTPLVVARLPLGHKTWHCLREVRHEFLYLTVAARHRGCLFFVIAFPLLLKIDYSLFNG